MIETTDREFDQWMKSPLPPLPQPRSDVDRILDAYMEYVEAHAHDPDWCAEQDAMYWEGHQGESYDPDDFDDETRWLDDQAYERWVTA